MSTSKISCYYHSIKCSIILNIPHSLKNSNILEVQVLFRNSVLTVGSCKFQNMSHMSYCQREVSGHSCDQTKHLIMLCQSKPVVQCPVYGTLTNFCALKNLDNSIPLLCLLKYKQLVWWAQAVFPPHPLLCLEVISGSVLAPTVLWCHGNGGCTFISPAL